jgi:hypothetical protein
MVMMTMMMMPAGENSWRPPELSGNPKSRVIWKKVGGMDEFCLSVSEYPKYLKGSLTCREILHHGTFGLTPHTKEGVLRIFIALKNLFLRPGLNTRPLSPVASTLTTTSSRRLTRLKWTLFHRIQALMF